jgi:hypothetical protein
MTPRWQVKQGMKTLAIFAIYLAAFHSLTLGPDVDLFTIWQQLLSMVLLVCVLPFHVMAAYDWIIGHWSERR